MGREQNAASPNAPFVTFRFVFGNAQAYERSHYPADRSPHAYATKQTHDRTGRDERSNTGNRQGANAGEPAERSTYDSSRTSARDSTFGSFGVLLVSKI